MGMDEEGNTQERQTKVTPPTFGPIPETKRDLGKKSRVGKKTNTRLAGSAMIKAGTEKKRDTQRAF